MMNLEQVTYYRLAREDERGHRGSIVQRPFTMALRLQPDGIDDPGGAVLKQLASGDETSERRLWPARFSLISALAHYEGEPDEPYPGRNKEAADNIRELLDDLTAALA